MITIVITDFRLIKDSDFYANRFALRTENGSLFSDTLEIVTLELPKIPKEGGGKLYDWLRFFKAEGRQEGLTEGLEKGLQQGLEQGRQEGMARMVQAARRLKGCGLEAADIALCTGLTLEQIAEI